jgi:hypothetical protein
MAAIPHRPPPGLQPKSQDDTNCSVSTTAYTLKNMPCVGHSTRKPTGAEHDATLRRGDHTCIWATKLGDRGDICGYGIIGFWPGAPVSTFIRRLRCFLSHKCAGRGTCVTL